jgi:hypothetical protein
MTPNIYLARLLATEREQDMTRYVAHRRQVAATKTPRPSWWDRLVAARRARRADRQVTGDTCIAA